MLKVAAKLSSPRILSVYWFHVHRICSLVSGRARLIRTRLIRSSTLFEVSLKSLPHSYYFMFKMHGSFEHG